MTIIWAALISSVLAYVLTSMANEPFNIMHAGALTAAVTIGIFLIDAFVLKEQED